MSKRKRTSHLSGILPLNKDKGLTSNAALYELKKLYPDCKVGHTGSLDPIATGMLVCCFGEATKLSSWLLNADKRYCTEVRLGIRTDTGDAEGNIIDERPVSLTCDQVALALDGFRGESCQIPPMYSAVKYKGKALYRLAREGREVERSPRKIHIYDLKMENFSPPFVRFSMHCSKGVYVRTVADDLGELLGCGAHVAELYRSEVTPFAESSMRSLDQLRSMSPEERTAALLPCDAHLGALPQLDVSPAVAERLRMGNSVPLRRPLEPGIVRIYSASEGFVGLAEVKNSMVYPKKILKITRHPGATGIDCRQERSVSKTAETLSEKRT